MAKDTKSPAKAPADGPKKVAPEVVTEQPVDETPNVNEAENAPQAPAEPVKADEPVEESKDEPEAEENAKADDLVEVTPIQNFFDRVAALHRVAGQSFMTTEARKAELKKVGFIK